MSNLRIAELDFDAIKSNLKAYLQSQDEFTDYDFEGSGLSVLLDILAYNTHYNAYLANMAINEMFLDSAVKRSSVVSLAKHLGYTPSSVRGAVANLEVTVNNPTGLPQTLTMDRYTQFSSTIDGKSYTFSTNRAYTASRNDATYVFEDVEVIEGTLSNFSFVVKNATPDEKFVIPEPNIDTTTIKVVVQNSASDVTQTVYNLATDITGIDENSKVFFLEQNTFGKYQIYFGDGIIGKLLTQGNIVTVSFIVSSGSGANVSGTTTQTFSALGTIGGSSNITTVVNSNSTGGADAESITSIKFNATRVNASKNRAVTAADYESLILANYSGAESVSVWGGEDNDPPYYGAVMISLKPYSGFSISDATKTSLINNVLKSKQVLSITPVFVDPEYIYVGVNANVKYNTNLTTLTSGQVKTSVLNTINSYFSTDLQKFNRSYNNSKLTSQILSSNSSIESVVITLKVQKRIVPTLNQQNIFSSAAPIKLRNPIKPGSLSSSHFYVNFNGVQIVAKFVDIPDDTPPNENGFGALRMVNAQNNSIIFRTVGTVDYSAGNITIANLLPTSLPTGAVDIRFTASVQESGYNVEVSRNEILLPDDTTTNGVIGNILGINVNVSTTV
jgi:hypothetical protein